VGAARDFGGLDEARSRLLDILVHFIAKTVTELSADVVEALRRAYEAEPEGFARRIYEAYFKNIEAAKARRAPLCQDTGVLEFFVRAGTKFPLLDMLEEAIVEATRRATAGSLLRPNVVDPFTGTNTGDNTGHRVPFIHFELNPGSDRLEVYLYVAGGGTSLLGAAKVFTPAEGLEAARDFVLETVAKYGLNACPPLIVGVGIGATAEIAALLSKKALLRRIGSRNPNPFAARLEEELRRDLNELGVGPQGLGGRVTALDVFVEYSHRHVATYAVGVSVGCWAFRRGLLVVYPDLRFEMPLHEG